MTGPNNSLWVDHLVNEVMPTARDMENAKAREAIRAAERRAGTRRQWLPAPGELGIWSKRVLIAAIVILGVLSLGAGIVVSSPEGSAPADAVGGGGSPVAGHADELQAITGIQRPDLDVELTYWDDATGQP
jgi:hypothetical protein